MSGFIMDLSESNVFLLTYNTAITVLGVILVCLAGYALKGARVLAVISGSGTNADTGMVGMLKDATRNHHIALIVLMILSLNLLQPLSTQLLEPYSKCEYSDGIKVTLGTDKKLLFGLNYLLPLEPLVTTTGNHLAALVQTGNLLSFGEGVQVSSSAIQYRNIKDGNASNAGTSLWGTTIEGRNTYSISKEFVFKCDGKVTRTDINNTELCGNVNKICDISGAYCEMNESYLYSGDKFAVHNVWIIGILQLSEGYSGKALATYDQSSERISVFGVDFEYNELTIFARPGEAMRVYVNSTNKSCPWIDPISVLDENITLKKTDSKCVVEMSLYCSPSSLSNNTWNCHTDASPSIWMEMDVDVDTVDGVEHTGGIAALTMVSHTEVYGDKDSIKRLIGYVIGDITTGATVTEQPWCNLVPSIRFVNGASYASIIVLVYILILSYYMVKGRNSIIPLPTSPLDGAEIVRREITHVDNYSKPLPQSTELFGIKYNDKADKDIYGITNVPQPYRRPLSTSNYGSTLYSNVQPMSLKKGCAL
jgi:hypothetical protein